MDLVDLFVSAEGTLGVVVEATLRLLPAPGAIWGLMAFLPSTAAAVGYVNALRRSSSTSVNHLNHATDNHAPRLAALEYFDSRCLDFLREHADELASKDISVPDPPRRRRLRLRRMARPRRRHRRSRPDGRRRSACPKIGADPDTAILADNPHDIEKLKLFRHAVPELVNSSIDERRKIHPGLVKLGTDMSVPDARLADVLALYEADLAATDLEHLIFGHIGANHLHVNILPRHPADYAAGRALYARWAAQVIAWGGSISAEHGIGKLKRDLFRQMAGDAALAQMRDLKSCFDPDWLLNPGTLMEAP